MAKPTKPMTRPIGIRPDAYARTMTLSPRATAWVYWGATVWLTLELGLGGAMDLVRGRSVVFAGDPVDVVVSSLGYPVYVLLLLGILKLLGAAVIAAHVLLRLKVWAYVR